MPKVSKHDHEAATAELSNGVTLRPGDTVYTTVSHVAASGMTRWIRVFVIRDNAPRNISWYVAKVAGYSVNTRNHEGVEVAGVGMDMGFQLVYSLSRALFRDGFDCVQYTAEGTDLAGNDWDKRCPSNDHTNDYRLHVLTRHSDGGYALRQRWL